MDQIDHDIVTGTDRGGDGRLSFLDQHLGVSQPHVGSMGQSGDTNQIGEIFRFRIDQHLHGEIRTELRHAQTAQFTSADILRFDPQSFCSRKKRHHVLLIQRDLFGVQSGKVFQHTDHGGIIVSQNIQFQKVSVNGMVVEMCGDDIAVLIICRMLHRREFFDFLSFGEDDDASWVLARSPADAGTSLNDPVDLAVSLMLSSLLKVIFYIAVSRLFRQGTDGSGLEGLPFSEDHLCIFMGVRLIFPGKVQVDIGFLISLESQESLKRDIKTFFFHFCSTVRTVPVRHVAAGHTAEFLHFRRIKVTVFALRTDIMRRKRIYLCNSRHGCRERGSYRSTGAYQISVLIGFMYQFLGNDIHYRITV